MEEAHSMAPGAGAASSTTQHEQKAAGDRYHDETGNVESAKRASGRGVQPSPPLTSQHSVNEKQKTKLDELLAACRNKDLVSLRALVTSQGGLIDDQTRRAAWPILLGCVTPEQGGSTKPWQDLPVHRDEDQVALDVNRSFVYYPRGETERRTAQRKEELSNTIVEVLRRHPYLCYFQGYHDIVQVLLLVLGAGPAVPAIEQLSILRIRDFMLPTMTGALSHLGLLPAILSAADHELYMHLSHTAPFYFALSATLTLYAHEIQEYGDIARLFDFLLAHESVISIYFFTSIICSRKKQLLELEAHEHDMLHSILSKLPSPLDLDGLIAQTDDLFRSHPPERLGGLSWYHISTNSVLKTTRSFPKLQQQTLAQGKAYFDKQAEEIRLQDVRRQQLQHLRRLAIRYRRPMLMTGTTVFVALLALYIRTPPPAFHVVVSWGSKLLHRAIER